MLPLLDRLSARRRPPRTLRVRVTSELHPRRDAEVVVPLVLEPGDDGIPRGVPQSRRGGALSGLARAGAMLRLPAGGRRRGGRERRRGGASQRPAVNREKWWLACSTSSSTTIAPSA